MTFEHDGQTYRIVFRYSKPKPTPRRWVVEEGLGRLRHGSIILPDHSVFPIDIIHLREIKERSTERRTTTCAIQRLCERVSPGFEWVDELTGSAVCSLEDQFHKETARRIALERAVKGKPAEVAGKAMAAYYNRKKGQRAKGAALVRHKMSGAVSS